MCAGNSRHVAILMKTATRSIINVVTLFHLLAIPITISGETATTTAQVATHLPTLVELEDGPNVCQSSERQYFPYYTMKTRTYTEQVKPKCDLLEKIMSILTKKCDPKTKVVDRLENVTKYEERLVIKRDCCDGYTRSLGKCFPFCPNQCAHGECVSPNVCKCDPGYSGRRCQYSCAGLTWGPNCTHKCDCKNSDKCDAETGDCICPAGWTGRDCSLPCQPGYYGPNCSVPCFCAPAPGDSKVGCDRFSGSCFGDHLTRCNSTTGICPCPPGYTGPWCKTPCAPGTYGAGCTGDCSHCHTLTTVSGFKSGEGKCNHVTGDCACPPGRTGRLCQLACPAGMFGANCSRTCDCADLALPEDGPFFEPSSDQKGSSPGTVPEREYYQTEGDNTCDPVDGKCICGKGYSGARCDQRICPSRMSMLSLNDLSALMEPIPSMGCTQKCDDNCDFKSGRVAECHPITGMCQCSAGWRSAPDCAVPCPIAELSALPDRRIVLRSRFGSSCGSACRCSRSAIEKLIEAKAFVTDTSDEGLIVMECDPVTGNCICPPGTFGDTCDKVCPNGTYGVGCQHTCQCKNRENAAPDTCNPISGSCPTCSSGFSGIRCNNPCHEGFWGTDCREKCSCQNGGSCDHVSGKCQCPPGYTGHACEAPCPPGYYGHGCVHKCPMTSHCPSRYFYDNTTCDRVHGGCACRAGFSTKPARAMSLDPNVGRALRASVCVSECESCLADQVCHPVKGCIYSNGNSYANLLRSAAQDGGPSKRSWFATVLPPLLLILVVAIIGTVVLFRRKSLRNKALQALNSSTRNKAGANVSNGRWHELRPRNNATPNLPQIYGEEPEVPDYSMYPTDPQDMRPIHGLPRRPLNPPKHVIAFTPIENSSSPMSLNTTHRGGEGGSQDGNFENPAYDDTSSTYMTIPAATNTDVIKNEFAPPVKEARQKMSNIEVANQLRRKNEGSGVTGGNLPPPQIPPKPKDPNLLDLDAGSFSGPGTSDDPFYLAFMSKKDKNRMANNDPRLVTNPLNYKSFGGTDETSSADPEDEINRAKEEASLEANKINHDFLRPLPDDMK